MLARSRTYIPARLADNPDLYRTGYAAVLAGLPEELRRAYRDGNFAAGLKDDDFQVIPTAWIELGLREGRNRQVRRMTAAVGLPTLRLIRFRVGPWDLDGLAPGAWRLLSTSV